MFTSHCAIEFLEKYRLVIRHVMLQLSCVQCVINHIINHTDIQSNACNDTWEKQ